MPTKVSSEKNVMYLDLIFIKSIPWPSEIDVPSQGMAFKTFFLFFLRLMPIPLNLKLTLNMI